MVLLPLLGAIFIPRKDIGVGGWSRKCPYVGGWVSVPTDRRSFRTGPIKILEDLKIDKRTSKDLFFDPGTIIRFFKMDSLGF